MKHIEKELMSLKDDVFQMWKLVLSQLEKSKQAFLNKDLELAREIISREKRVNAFELKIDSNCENYIALYSPVAIDLRLILSLLNISSTLERIGDFAAGIALQTLDQECERIDEQLIEDLNIEEMFNILQTMVSDAYVALESENTKVAGKILARDEDVDRIYRNSLPTLTKHMTSNPQDISCGLKLLLLIRKLERIGDHCSNIIEEIVFYIDAKVLKHQAYFTNPSEDDN